MTFRSGFDMIFLPGSPLTSHPLSESPVKRESLVQSLVLAMGVAALGACASSGPSVGTAGSTAPTPDMSVAAPSPDPRVGLRAGVNDAAEAIWNLRLVSTTLPSPEFRSPQGLSDARFWNSDLGFTSHYVIQGSFSGYQVWDIAN